MDKVININEFVKNLDSENCMFIGEKPETKVNLETLILEKLWTYEDIKPSDSLCDNADGWKKIAIALAMALIVDYSENNLTKVTPKKIESAAEKWIEKEVK